MKSTWRISHIVHRLRARCRALDNFLAICGASTADSATNCTICGRSVTRSITFGCAEYVNGLSVSLPEVQTHRKYLCSYCGHFFTPWLDIDLEQISTKYQDIYDSNQLFQENERASYQLDLIRYALKHLDGKENVAILDFGCGPNRSPTMTMREAGYDVRCCDILDRYVYDGDIFFRYDMADTRWFGSFDAIVSIDVIEHLGNTVSAWRSLSRLLKADGIMAHCFPTRLHYSLNNNYCATPFHTCIFSRKSLRMLAAKTGFKLEAIEPFQADVPFVFRFRKIRESE
ncbi:MAG: class I SAM-dependent methyltransferase [Candidatus Omnitrophica bacterium]|nr:class I SAM-dependent methyltransferase [Candidatus Omnitrophota bacterium]